MQQRQLRLGDILDDYCPRERRLTNHVVVAMVGDDVKQTRCTTCDAEHEFKHARLPKQRRKIEPGALGAPVMPAPKKVVHEPPPAMDVAAPSVSLDDDDPVFEAPTIDALDEPLADETVSLAASDDDHDDEAPREEGPVHRQLIRAQLPRLDGQPPAPRQGPDFTIRQPAGRPGRFRPRQERGAGGGMMFGNRSNGNVARDPRGGQRGPGGGHANRPGNRQGHGRKRSK
jgi:hypothetical protein